MGFFFCEHRRHSATPFYPADLNQVVEYPPKTELGLSLSWGSQKVEMFRVRNSLWGLFGGHVNFDSCPNV